MRRRLAGGLLLLFVAACATTAKRDYTPVAARFFLESAEGSGGVVTLPQSGTQIAVAGKPVITEFDVVSVEIVRVELGQCLMFQLTGAAARDLYRFTTTNQGRRLVLALNGEAYGARRIERPLEDGVVLIFVEKPDAALPELVANLRKTAAELQREAARKS